MRHKELKPLVFPLDIPKKKKKKPPTKKDRNACKKIMSEKGQTSEEKGL